MANYFISERSIDETAPKILAIIKQCVQDYKTIRSADRNAKLQTLRPGEPVPDEGAYMGFFDKNKLNAYETQRRKYAAEIDEIIRNMEDRLQGYRAAAPAEEDLRAITALSMIKNPDSALIDAVMVKHGENYLASKIIEGIGADNRHFFSRHWADKTEDKLASLQKVAADLAPETVENITDSRLQFLEFFGDIPEGANEGAAQIVATGNITE